MKSYLHVLVINIWVIVTLAQDYQVADISCTFADDVTNEVGGEKLSAKLKKPPGFKGHPLFADDRKTDSLSDKDCQIRPDHVERTGHVYNLLVLDFSKCGIAKKDGYVHLRVWFPQLDGVVLATDQEVVIMCKPASPTIIENRAAGFAGSLPSSGRVSGVVEESPGRLEYEVALYREMGAAKTGDGHTPVDQAVPIGSKLQLRARISTQAAWKFAKLIEVTVSGDPNNPYSPGYVALVHDGCRQQDFSSIVPQQPHRSEELPGEVRLDFEAFMLDSKEAGSSQLWIHATVKACIEGRDCLPEFCLDLLQPSGHGRRRRRRDKTTYYADGLLEVLGEAFPVPQTGPSNSKPRVTQIFVTSLPPARDVSMMKPKAEPLTTVHKGILKQGTSARIGDNVGVTVIMPEEFFAHTEALYQSCATFMVLSGVLGCAVLMAATFMCILMSRLHKAVAFSRSVTLERVMQDHVTKYGDKPCKRSVFK